MASDKACRCEFVGAGPVLDQVWFQNKMSSLRTWNAPQTLVAPRDNIVQELFEPALSRAYGYKRAVGFFSSSWLARNSKGLASLAVRGGSVQWITSPHLSTEDWEALREGSVEPSDLVERLTLREVESLATSLEKDTLNTLAWLVHDGVLQFRIALPMRPDHQGHDFHTKFGVFSDEAGPAVAFVGSLNESDRSLANHEIISVFSSSRAGDLERVAEFDSLFEALWDNRDTTYEVFTLPEAAKRELIRHRSPSRPLADLHGNGSFRRRLRDYQEAALESWIANGRHGIFEMATGTGKTITALACAEEILSARHGVKILLIACPFQHLVDQWGDQVKELGVPVVCAHDSSKRWRPELYEHLQAVTTGVETAVAVITTYTTLCSPLLQTAIEPYEGSVLFIADECHNLGSTSTQPALQARYPYRLGLSATPERYFDTLGTSTLHTFFGGVCFRFDMEQAISGGFLVPYTYQPEIVELTADESDEYARLSAQLARLAFGAQTDTLSDAAKQIAMKRARVLNNAEGKLDWLEGHMQARAAASWKHTLVYSGDRLFSDVTTLLGTTLGLRVHEFTSRQSRKTRQLLLQRFSEGDLQVLAAMKCLDEGVDVPPTRTAFFLASSGNPREFIQRRGRILRNSPGKHMAHIVDSIALPHLAAYGAKRDSPDWRALRAALRSQLKRVGEFARLAQNRIEAEDALFDIRKRYDLPDTSRQDDEAGSDI